MYNKLILVCSILFLAACSSSPATQTTAQKSEAEKVQTAKTTTTKADSTATKDSDLICRTERPLGTRFGKKVCRTRAQVEEDKQKAKDMMPRHRECTGPREVCI